MQFNAPRSLRLDGVLLRLNHAENVKSLNTSAKVILDKGKTDTAFFRLY